MLAATGPAAPATSRWLTTALFASLAFNLVVVGIAAGFVWRHGTRLQNADAAHLPRSVLAYTTLLPEQRQKELSALTEQERGQVRPLRRQLRNARDEVVKVMVAEPFDKQRFAEAQARLLDADQKARAAVYRLYAEIAAGMTPEERQGYANWRENRRRPPNPLDAPDKQANGAGR